MRMWWGKVKHYLNRRVLVSLLLSLPISVQADVPAIGGSTACTPSGGSDVMFLLDNSGSIDANEFSSYASMVLSVGNALQAANSATRIAVAHYAGTFGGVDFGQNIYFERDFSTAAIASPIRQFGTGGVYNPILMSDNMAGAVYQATYGLDGNAGTTSTYILSPLKELSRDLTHPLQIVIFTDATRDIPGDSAIIDGVGYAYEPNDGSNFTIYNLLKNQGVMFSIVAISIAIPEVTRDPAAAAIASKGGSWMGDVEANPNDPEGSATVPRRFETSTNFVLSATQLTNFVNAIAAVCPSINYDYGDAPASYGTPSHKIADSLKLGMQGPDSESTAQANVTATGDDTSGTDDEDGVVSFPTLLAGVTSYSMPATTLLATGTGTLHAWIDFDKNGVFTANEYASVTVTNGTLAGALSWSGITVGSAGTTYARLRFTSTSLTDNVSTAVDERATAAASDGEVEDYALSIVAGAALGGLVFEDINYGGGAGRSQTACNGSGIGNATVELYNSSGTLLASTTTASNGRYTFNPVLNGNYFVRVVNSTVKSTRAGSNGTERGIQTFRSNGTTSVTTERGGRNPFVSDAAANTSNQTLNTTTFILSDGGQAQSVQPLTVSGVTLLNLDFGFNFDTVVNANDSGQGSLRQALYNANLLGGDTSLTQVNQTAGKEALIFALTTNDPKYNSTAQLWTIPLASPLPTIYRPVVLDGTKQTGFINKPVIALDGSNAGSGDGLTLGDGSSGSVIQALSIHHSPKAGIGIIYSANNLIGGINTNQGNVLINNQGAGIRVVSAMAVKNSLLGNSLNLNGGLGIDLGDNGVTSNDAGDVDNGPNELLNYPVVTLNGFGTNGTRILAYDLTLDAPAGNYRLEFFTSPTADASGYGEGQIFLGAKDIKVTGGIANIRGTLNATQSVAAGALISMTLTAKTTNGYGSTSEFSAQERGTNTSVCQDLTTNTGTQTVMVDENFTPLAMLKAKDSQGAPINYVISGGLDKNLFILRTPATGATLDCTTVQFVTSNLITTRAATLDTTLKQTRATALPPIGNYELPLDSNQDNVYEVEITATLTSGETVVRTLDYKILNINEIPIITSGSTATVTEDSSTMVQTIQAIDPDQGDMLRFFISKGDDAAAFSLDEQTGVLSFRTPPDYDTPLDANQDNAYQVEVSVTDQGGLVASKALTINVSNNLNDDGVVVQTRAFLQGAFDTQQQLMNNTLNSLGVIPTQQPYGQAPFAYTNSETLSTIVRDTPAPKGLVDWILVDLRSSPTTIVATRALALRQDGQVVDAASGSPLLHFAHVPPGNYYVGLRHRNHLGIMTASPFSLSTSTTSAPVVDFTLPSTATLEKDSRLVVDKVAVLWSGDINHSHTLSAYGPVNDITVLLGAVLLAEDNTQHTTNFAIAGYQDGDLNFDGKVLFTGPANDTNLLLGNILLHPQNKNLVTNFIIRNGLSP